MNDTNCPFGFEVIEGITNATELDKLIWPCELRVFWVEIYPFVTLVRGLLSYGTVFIIVLGLMFNLTSLLVLTRKHMRKSTMNLYLSALAIYDCLALTMNFMIGVLRGQNKHINKDFQDHEDLCKFHGVIVEVFNLLSIWIIVSFTIERFIMIKFPLKGKQLMTPRRAVFVIIGVSLGVLVFSMHKIAVSGFEGDSVFGYAACKTRRAIFVEIIYFYVAFNTWFPTLTIVTLNTLILLEIRKNKKKREQMTSQSMSKSDEKATKLLLLVSSAYVVLVLPLGLIQSTELIWNNTQKVLPTDPDYIYFMSTKIRLKWARAFFFFFYQLNFAVNFFLYVSSSSATRFRATLKMLLGIKVDEQEMTWNNTMKSRATKINSVAPAQSDDGPSSRDLHSKKTEFIPESEA
ncbi:G-protein coupled receptor 35-like [Mytilus californianus]|uniref:G-protein coupled receptor 35-like n=1 Tax=Mytilus californianus TaxID=6549 RepID=UPI002246AD57|nr:G-protein coupled receptor 35-like [Mytilus californianus]